METGAAAGAEGGSQGQFDQLCAAPIPMIIQSDHLQLHKDDEPLPHCLGDWTGEHDMAEAGELAHASMVRAGMRLWSTSADVPEEGPNKEPAMQQAPCCDAALSVQG